MKKLKRSNLIFVVIVVLMLIPQTRKPIQVWISKGVALVIKPSPIAPSERKTISDYNWSLKDGHGKTVSFEDLKGKVVVLNFWATWCPPCIAEMPSLQSLYLDYKSNKDIAFLFVSNEDIDTINAFIQQKDYSFPVFQPLTQYPSDFNITTIPRTFVIGRSGEIVIDKSGAADWNSDVVKQTIEELLKAF